MTDCVFCKIVAGDAPAEVLQRSKTHVIITPLDPHVRGHVLVIPTVHVTSAVTNPITAGLTFVHAARWLRAMGPQGNLLTSAGPLATQTVNHLHIHVIPRGPSHDLPTDWPWMREGH